MDDGYRWNIVDNSLGGYLKEYKKQYISLSWSFIRGMDTNNLHRKTYQWEILYLIFLNVTNCIGEMYIYDNRRWKIVDNRAGILGYVSEKKTIRKSLYVYFAQLRHVQICIFLVIPQLSEIVVERFPYCFFSET